MYKDTKENGITLVTLVVTIILLLILAGVTISYISGGGIIDRTQVAMDQYENADKREQDIIDDIDDYNKQEIDLEPVYSEEGAEDNIAPAELFEYEIINDGSIASSYMQNLPTKTAKITGINPNYIERQNVGYHEWYYKIKYDGITDVLVIPYQAELDENGNVTENGEMYKILEVDLSIKGWDYYGSSFPSIKKVIYPNTVEKIESNENITGGGALNTPVEVILSKNLKNIGYRGLAGCSFSNIEIPESVTYIGKGAFSGTDITNIEIPHGINSIEESTFSSTNLNNIIIPKNVKSIKKSAFQYCSDLKNVEILGEVKSIEDNTFNYCGLLENIKIPESISNIGVRAFGNCTNLKKIVIPESVEYIGSSAFEFWGEDQTIYFECSEDESKNWAQYWDYNCKAKIVWDYNPDGATE